MATIAPFNAALMNKGEDCCYELKLRIQFAMLWLANRRGKEWLRSKPSLAYDIPYREDHPNSEVTHNLTYLTDSTSIIVFKEPFRAQSWRNMTFFWGPHEMGLTVWRNLNAEKCEEWAIMVLCIPNFPIRLFHVYHVTHVKFASKKYSPTCCEVAEKLFQRVRAFEELKELLSMPFKRGDRLELGSCEVGVGPMRRKVATSAVSSSQRAVSTSEDDSEEVPSSRLRKLDNRVGISLPRAPLPPSTSNHHDGSPARKRLRLSKQPNVELSATVTSPLQVSISSPKVNFADKQTLAYLRQVTVSLRQLLSRQMVAPGDLLDVWRVGLLAEVVDWKGAVKFTENPWNSREGPLRTPTIVNSYMLAEGVESYTTQPAEQVKLKVFHAPTSVAPLWVVGGCEMNGSERIHHTLNKEDGDTELGSDTDLQSELSSSEIAAMCPNLGS